MKYLSYFLLSVCFVNAYPQENFPKLSFPGQIEQLVGFDTISVSYERPSVRGRKIFGGLVPYGKLWRTGASYATKLTFSNDVEIAEKTIPKGSYALLSIPGPESWTLILNTASDMFGTYEYDEAKDILRIEVPAKKSGRFYEAFTIDIDVIPNNARIYISWEETTVSFTVKTQTDARMEAFIQDSLLTGIYNDGGEYALATEHLIYLNKQLDTALTLADLAIKKGGESYGYVMRMRALIALERYQEALKAAAEGKKYDEAHNIDGGTYYDDAIAEIQGLMEE